ncbi:ABC transporter substrate-binding protein [Phosphitispora sp. TUW77]|uniref:ABC transporter substrate-binding protein n=1 Tax=Phosphitispora sp. TUW77 TaxID=3152361 RepID=UPI003AB12AB8
MLLVFISGCSGSSISETGGKSSAGSSPASDTGVTIKAAAIKGPSALSMVHMIENDQFLNEKVKVQYIIKDNPETVRAMLVNSEVDIATIPTNLAAILYNKGVKYRAAAVVLWGTLYLVGKNDIDVQKWSDLKNKRIYLMAKGMTPDICFRYMLEKNGIDPQKDVILDYRYPMPQDLAGAVAAGRANLAVLSEPMVSTLLAKNSSLKIILDLSREWDKSTEDQIPLPQTCVFVKNDFALKYPEIVAVFLNEYKNSIQWVTANTKEAGELAVKHEIMPMAEVAADTIPRCNMRYEDAFNVKGGINAYLKVFYDFNPTIVGGALPDEGLYYKR